MDIKKKLNKIIEVEFQIDKLYEKVSDAEFYEDKEELKKNLDYIRFLKEVEEEQIEKLDIHKQSFYEIMYLLNSDNYLGLLFSINEITLTPNYKVNIDNIMSACHFLFYNAKKENKKEATLNYFMCNTVNHPLIRRLFYKIMESYYKKIENPPLNFDAFITHAIQNLNRKGGRELLTDIRENAIALLYLDVYAQFESTFLANANKEEYKKDVDLKDFLIELKRYISFSNPNLESYLLSNDKTYINPSALKLEEKYKKGNRSAYKQIREDMALINLREIIMLFQNLDIAKEKTYNKFYKLYIKSRATYLTESQINELYVLLLLTIKRKGNTNILFEALEEEKKYQMEKRKNEKIQK